MGEAIGGKAREPSLAKLLSAGANAGVGMSANTVRHQKSCVLRPAIAALREPYLVLAQGLAMRGAGVVFVRCALGHRLINRIQMREAASLMRAR